MEERSTKHIFIVLERDNIPGLYKNMIVSVSRVFNRAKDAYAFAEDKNKSSKKYSYDVIRKDVH